MADIDFNSVNEVTFEGSANVTKVFVKRQGVSGQGVKVWNKMKTTSKSTSKLTSKNTTYTSTWTTSWEVSKSTSIVKSRNTSKNTTTSWNTGYVASTSKNTTKSRNTNYSASTSWNTTKSRNTNYSASTSWNTTKSRNTEYTANTSKNTIKTRSTNYTANTSKNTTKVRSTSKNTTTSWNTGKVRSTSYAASTSKNTAKNTNKNTTTSYTAATTWNTQSHIISPLGIVESVRIKKTFQDEHDRDVHTLGIGVVPTTDSIYDIADIPNPIDDALDTNIEYLNIFGMPRGGERLFAKFYNDGWGSTAFEINSGYLLEVTFYENNFPIYSFIKPVKRDASGRWSSDGGDENYNAINEIGEFLLDRDLKIKMQIITLRNTQSHIISPLGIVESVRIKKTFQDEHDEAVHTLGIGVVSTTDSIYDIADIPNPIDDALDTNIEYLNIFGTLESGERLFAKFYNDGWGSTAFEINSGYFLEVTFYVNNDPIYSFIKPVKRDASGRWSSDGGDENYNTIAYIGDVLLDRDLKIKMHIISL